MNFANMFGLSVPSFMYTSDSIQDIFNKNKDTFKLDISTYAKTGFNLNIFAGDTWIHNDTSITFKIERTNNPYGPRNPIPVVVTTQTPCAVDHGVKGLVLFHKGDKKYEDIAVPLGGIGQFGYSQLDGVLHVEAEAIYLDNKAAAVRLTFRLNQNILNSHKDYVKTITLHKMAGYLVTGVYLPPIPSNKPKPTPQPEPTPGGTPKPTPHPQPIPSPAPQPTTQHITQPNTDKELPEWVRQYVLTHPDVANSMKNFPRKQGEPIDEWLNRYLSSHPLIAADMNKYHSSTPSYGQYTPGTGGGYQPTGNYNAGSSSSGIDTKTMLMIGAIAVVAIFIFLKK